MPRPGLDASAAEAVDDTLCALLAGWVAEGFLPLLRVVHEVLSAELDAIALRDVFASR